MALEKVKREAEKERARGFRTRRSAAFKRNVERFGLAKAKFIANIITMKRKKLYFYVPADGVRKE